MTGQFYEIITALPADYGDKGPYYARLEVNGRMTWRTKRIAEKHAREFKGAHLRDAWVQEA